MAVKDIDQGTERPERDLGLPWLLDPVRSWLAYDIWLEVELDPGTVLHKPLPQQADPVDSLTAAYFDDKGYDAAKGGTLIGSASSALDVIQRMATSTYRYTLVGHALRVGFQVPIPGLKTVGGQPAVPTAPQRAYNRLVANWSGGVPVFYAAWSLPYLVARPARSSPGLQGGVFGGRIMAPVPPNPALAIRADAQLPELVRLPQAVIDEAAAPLALVAVPPPGQGQPPPFWVR